MRFISIYSISKSRGFEQWLSFKEYIVTLKYFPYSTPQQSHHKFDCWLLFVYSTCNQGRWQCSEDRCSQTCYKFDYGHFKTFDGLDFDFLDKACTYTLAKVCTLSNPFFLFFSVEFNHPNSSYILSVISHICILYVALVAVCSSRLSSGALFLYQPCPYNHPAQLVMAGSHGEV